MEIKTEFKPAAWLKNAVFYEIYPQSFCDSNGDGIGDLPGIISKLDYIQDLGANALWLNPCFDSPFQDAGYDVRDFRKVAVRYGANDDLVKLFEECHKRGMHVLLDFVAGHTSIEHEWFKQAVSGKDTPYNNFFCFTNGWGDQTGAYYHRFISGYGNRDGYYMINFFYSQPALNYGFLKPDPRCKWQLPVDHPDVQKVRREMRDVMDFWLNLGCDGFRVDMAPSLVRTGDPNDQAAKSEGISQLWHEYKTWMNEKYPEAVLCSEWGQPTQAIGSGFDMDFFFSWGNGDPAFHSAFRKEAYFNGSCEMKPGTSRSFFIGESTGNSRTFADEFLHEVRHNAGHGYPCLVTGNHDLARIRRGRTYEDLKVMYTCIFTMPGAPYLYYGDEIGMNYVPNLGNIEGSYERGGARTPMQWTSDRQTAGFSTAAPEKFYAPLDPSADRPCVETQQKDADSLYNYTKKLLALRQAHVALQSDGVFDILVSEKTDAPFIYTREANGEKFLIALNPSNSKTYSSKVGIDGTLVPVMECGSNSVVVKNGYTEINLGKVSAVIYQVK